MTNPPATVPDGYTTVTPWIAVKGAAEFLDFLANAFDAHELARVPNPDGAIGHWEVRIGDAVVMGFDVDADGPSYPALLRLFVPDAAAAVRRAVQAGARVVTEPTALFWGDKVGRVADPWGNLWWLQERFAEPTPDEIQRLAADPEELERMRYVQDTAAEELRRPR